MGLNDTPKSERLHIGFFGRRNAGKSSVVNAVANQKMSLVSDIKGTTTDPVEKAMELLPVGPVVIIDTAGSDDEGTLGKLRVRETNRVLNRVDCAVLVVDGTVGMNIDDKALVEKFTEKKIPYVVVFNKCDMPNFSCGSGIAVSAKSGAGIENLKKAVSNALNTEKAEQRLCGDFVNKNDFVVLVIPIDSAAPKGRIILPQQMAIRDILDSGAVPVCVRDTELKETLKNLGKMPCLVITDSQVFKYAADIVPKDVPLTSFSILMARYRGFLNAAVNGARAIDTLKNGDKILISEGCTHHRQCGDIGTVKLPRLLKKYTGKNFEIVTSSGKGFPDDLSEFSLVIHCGACMLNNREVLYRMNFAADSNVPFTNYGISIAYMNGILDRSVDMFDESAI